MNRVGRLQGKTAIVTGAASGIGRATAQLFAEEGAYVVLVDRNEPQLNGTQSEVVNGGGACTTVCGDVALAETAEQAVRAAVGMTGRLDVVFNNAGIMPTGDILEFPDELWDEVLTVNLKAMFLLCKKAIPEMLKHGKGSIINTSSVMASLTEPGYTAYTASKAGIIGLTKEIAVSFAERGIRCNAICPGWVDTDMNLKLVEELGGVDKLYPIIKRQQPLGRMATTREVAYAVLFLASDESTAITGACIPIDGAASASI